MKFTYCLIASIFLGASLLTTIKCTDCAPFSQYEQTLDEEQKQLYKEIKTERAGIYVKGLLLGMIFGGLYFYNVMGTDYTLAHSCAILSIIMGTQYLVYQLHPKKNWMLNSLKTREQIDGWLEVYKHMKGKYHLGMLLGLVGFGLLSYGGLAN